MSQPCSRSIRANSTAWSQSKPPRTQSVAEIRTLIGFDVGHTARQASNTSSGNRARSSSEPPYPSSRVLVSGERKLESRYPCAQCSSSRSNPAASAP